MIKRLLNKVVDKISGPFVFMKGYLKSVSYTHLTLPTMAVV